MQGAKNQLDDRDKWRNEKDADFRAKSVEAPPTQRYVKREDREEKATQKLTN
jgi:hypothetical protein